MRELQASIRAVLRRKAPAATDAPVEIADLRPGPAMRRVSRLAQEPKAGATEFRLLHFLLVHPGRVHSRAQLLQRVWGDRVCIEKRTVNVHVMRLREALAPVGCARISRPCGHGLSANAA